MITWIERMAKLRSGMTTGPRETWREEGRGVLIIITREGPPPKRSTKPDKPPPK